jgi:hypothetical protein
MGEGLRLPRQVLHEVAATQMADGGAGRADPR